MNDVIKYWYSKKKGSNYDVGVIAVIYTFGGDLKWNPHVHDLVTEGELIKKQNGGNKLSIFHIHILKSHGEKFC